MTPEQAAKFVRSDCQDPELRALADAAADAAFEQAMQDPAFRAAWQANLRRMADAIDAQIVREFRDAVAPKHGTDGKPL